MRTMITLSVLGLTLALSGAAGASPLDRSTGEQLQTYRFHKRIYGHDQKRSVGTDRLQDRGDRPAVGTASTVVRKPA